MTITNETAIPVVEECIGLEKRSVETSRVHVRKTTVEDHMLLKDALVEEKVKIDRVPIGRFVDEPVEVRYEGDTVIVPVLEEVPVVVKRLRLKEEVRITRERIAKPYRQRVNVRREQVSIKRAPRVSGQSQPTDSVPDPLHSEEER